MIEPASGVLLISDPFLKDPNFSRTVVLICEHDAHGSFGLVLNRFTEFTVGDLMTDLEEFDLPVYYGGPVQTDTLHFIHQLPEQIPGGLEICKDVYWGGDFSTLTQLLKLGTADTSKIHFYLGYSGWSAGQLEQEMNEKTWLTVASSAQLIFDTDINDIWKNALNEMGGKYKQLINYPIDPQLN